MGAVARQRVVMLSSTPCSRPKNTSAHYGKPRVSFRSRTLKKSTAPNSEDMYAHDSIQLLKNSGIDFEVYAIFFSLNNCSPEYFPCFNVEKGERLRARVAPRRNGFNWAARTEWRCRRTVLKINHAGCDGFLCCFHFLLCKCRVSRGKHGLGMC